MILILINTEGSILILINTEGSMSLVVLFDINYNTWGESYVFM